MTTESKRKDKNIKSCSQFSNRNFRDSLNEVGKKKYLMCTTQINNAWFHVDRKTSKKPVKPVSERESKHDHVVVNSDAGRKMIWSYYEPIAKTKIMIFRKFFVHINQILAHFYSWNKKKHANTHCLYIKVLHMLYSQKRPELWLHWKKQIILFWLINPKLCKLL